MMSKSIGVALFFLMGWSAIAQQKGSLLTSNERVEIPFELTEHNNMLMSVVLNEKDTLKLMFHTAADAVNLTEEATQKLQLNFGRTDSVKSWGGDQNTSRFSENNTLRMGALYFEGVPIWEDRNSGQRSDGKFGMNLFEGKVIEIDFENKILSLTDQLPTEIKDYSQYPLIKDNTYLFIEATSIMDAASIPNRFLIHSGYAGAVLLDDQFVSDFQISEKLEIVDQKELKDSFGNVLKVQKAVLPGFQIGTIVLKDVPVGFFSGALSRQKMSVIGGDVLKRFQIIIDSNREFIYLKINKLNWDKYSNY